MPRSLASTFAKGDAFKRPVEGLISVVYACFLTSLILLSELTVEVAACTVAFICVVEICFSKNVNILRAITQYG